MSKQILIVDDEDDIRAVARLSLERIGGWRVLEAATALDAVELAVLHCPDVILLDVMMPRFDGPATFGLLQADERTRAIPVLMLTAQSERAAREEWLALGVRGVLSKPFDPVQLPAQVTAVLGWTS